MRACRTNLWSCRLGRRILKRYREDMDALYRFVALCARATCEDAHYAQIARAAAEVQDWDALPAQAETHGVAPLLYTHARAADVPIPSDVQRELQGLYLRHRLVNRVRMRVLRDVLRAFEAAGIPALVLKGAALANLIYPEPGLRPMRDVDVLVAEAQARRAQRVLADLGFHAPLPTGDGLPDKHLAAATLHTQGFLISVEVHYKLFDKDHPPAVAMEDLRQPSIPFPIDDAHGIAYAPGYEDLLWHVCQHMIFSGGVFGTNRLIWVADVVSFAEYFVNEMDWERVNAPSTGIQYPIILSTLSLLHFLTPLSKTLLTRAPIALGPMPQGVGEGFRGWPHSSLAMQRQKGLWGIVRDTFWPPEWWVRLYYGVGSVRPIFWYRWVRHPLHILRWVGHLLAEWLRGA